MPVDIYKHPPRRYQGPGRWTRMIGDMRAYMEDSETPEFQGNSAADDRDPRNLRDLYRAIEMASNPNARAILEEEKRRLEEVHRHQMEQAAIQMMQQRLEQRLNPRIGTAEDTDPQVNFMFRLMDILRRRHGRVPTP